MNTITYIFILVSLIFAGLIPIFKKIYDLIQLGINKRQFELLRKVVENAVAHINQIDMIEEMSADRKKELAISLARDLANTFGIPQNKQVSIGTLIESVLWGEDGSGEEELDD